MLMTDSTPARYQAATRKYEDKDWLYEQYWGEMLTIAEIAEQCDEGCPKHVREAMIDFGIPRRSSEAYDDSKSSFRGFYRGKPTFHGDAQTNYDPEYAVKRWTQYND
jgi:hypothetical protein